MFDNLRAEKTCVFVEQVLTRTILPAGWYSWALGLGFEEINYKVRSPCVKRNQN